MAANMRVVTALYSIARSGRLVLPGEAAI